MRRIAIINQKGGVGKTTTSVSLGAALALRGYRVLLIDLDPQGHLTLHLGLDAAGVDDAGDRVPTTYDLLVQSTPIREARRLGPDGLFCVGSHIELAAAEPELMSIVGREMILRDLVAAEEGEYDYVLMDCPPSLGLLTLNALAAAKEVFLPVQAHFLALQGMGNLLKTVSLVSQRINPELRVTGIVLCMFESGTRLAAEVVGELQNFLTEARQASMPWANAKLFRTRIRRNIRLAEAPSHGKTIFEYAPSSNGAIDYEALADEVLADASVGAACAGADAGGIDASHPRPEIVEVTDDDAPQATGEATSRAPVSDDFVPPPASHSMEDSA
jgi:chromosome partitioning protein